MRLNRKAAPDPVEDAPETAERARRAARLPTHWLRHLLTVVVLGLAGFLLFPYLQHVAGGKQGEAAQEA